MWDAPKAAHLLCGKPLARYAVDLLRAVGVERVMVVVGCEAEQALLDAGFKSPRSLGAQIRIAEERRILTERLGKARLFDA